jgi:hypothetical protein
LSLQMVDLLTQSLVLSAQCLSLALRTLRAFAEHVRILRLAVVVSRDSRLWHPLLMPESRLPSLPPMRTDLEDKWAVSPRNPCERAEDHSRRWPDLAVIRHDRHRVALKLIHPKRSNTIDVRDDSEWHINAPDERACGLRVVSDNRRARRAIRGRRLR